MKRGWLLAGLSWVFLIGCGSSSSSNDAASAGRSVSGSNAGGSSGASPSLAGSGGSNAGGGATAQAGSGGSAAASAVNALDPSLPKPSYDCLTDTTAKSCVSISGTFNGMSIDMHCALPDSPMLGGASPDAWLTGCRPSMMFGVGYWYQISVPWQLPGRFDLKRSTGQADAGADEILVLDYSGVDFTTDNFVSGEVAGSVEPDADPAFTIVSGTFRGTWSAPAARCSGDAVDTCYAAQVTGSFRSAQFITFLDHQ